MSASRENRCLCGKVGWISKAEAEDVLVRAKIRFSLHGNTKRRETRVYECTRRRGTYHLTSQPERTPGTAIAPPRYAVDDIDAARDYITGVIFHDDASAWDDLLSIERAEQTLRALGLMHQATIRNLRRQPHEGEGREAFQRWRDYGLRSAEILVERIRDARQAVKRANIARAATQERQERDYFRKVIRRLALELDAHRRAVQPWGSPADEHLWALLDAIRMPSGDEPITIGGLVKTGRWELMDEEPDLDGEMEGRA